MKRKRYGQNSFQGPICNIFKVPGAKLKETEGLYIILLKLEGYGAKVRVQYCRLYFKQAQGLNREDQDLFVNISERWWTVGSFPQNWGAQLQKNRS